MSEDIPHAFVIDDEPELGDIMEQFLLTQNYTVSTFTNPRTALTKVTTEKPDLIITDIVMPQMNGVELIAQLNEITPSTPIICLSGHATDSTKKSLENYNVAGFLPKPFDLKDLLSMIQKVSQQPGETVKSIFEATTKQTSTATQPITNQGVILIVDDYAPFRNVVKMLFSGEGYRVDEAIDGVDALALVEANEYDVVIMDINMPRMSGADALRKMKSIDPYLMVVMITGEAESNTIEKCEGLTGYVCLRKPIDNNELVDKIRQFDHEGMRKRREVKKSQSASQRLKNMSASEKMAYKGRAFARKNHLSRKSLAVILMLIVIGAAFAIQMSLDKPKEENQGSQDGTAKLMNDAMKYLYRDEQRELVRDSKY